MAKVVRPHEFVPPEPGTVDDRFGWCARVDCGSTRAAYVHASAEERAAFDLDRAIAATPAERMVRARWMFEFLVNRESWFGCRDWDGLSLKVKAAFIDMAAHIEDFHTPKAGA